jgi:hypothetical protein
MISDIISCLDQFLSSNPRFGRFRAVLRPNMRPECLVLVSFTDRATLWHALGAPRSAKEAFWAFWVRVPAKMRDSHIYSACVHGSHEIYCYLVGPSVSIF